MKFLLLKVELFVSQWLTTANSEGFLKPDSKPFKDLGENVWPMGDQLPDPNNTRIYSKSPACCSANIQPAVTSRVQKKKIAKNG